MSLTPGAFDLAVEAPTTSGPDFSDLAGSWRLNIQSSLVSGLPWWQTNDTAAAPYWRLRWESSVVTWELRGVDATGFVKFRVPALGGLTTGLSFTADTVFTKSGASTPSGWQTPTALTVALPYPARLLHSPQEVVRQLLVDKGYCTDPEASPLQPWPAYANKEPDEPDNAVWLNRTAGRDRQRLQPTGEAPRLPGFQVTVRAADENTLGGKAEEIRAGLLLVYEDAVTVDGTGYVVHSIAGVGDVLNIGSPPSSRRVLATLNALVNVRRA